MKAENNPDPTLLPEDEQTQGRTNRASRKNHLWSWLLSLVIVGIPLIVTLIGFLTSPSHVSHVPVGQIVYMDADEPSNHTTNLRGMQITLPQGDSRLLLHETEPQDTDSGSREWINEPTASPDGTNIAFIKQVITLQEEQQSVVNQIWLISLNNPQPRLLLDLTQHKLKRPVGLAWTPDGKSVVFLEDTTAYRVFATESPTLSSSPLAHCPPLKTSREISATRSPVFTPDGDLIYAAETEQGTRIVGLSSAPGTSVYALSPDGQLLATVQGNHLTLTSTTSSAGKPQRFLLHWGWSLFGGRQVTSLHWSPDGHYLGYTVSKPPVPEDEVFYLDVASGKTYQLALRTGRAGWDWTR